MKKFIITIGFGAATLFISAQTIRYVAPYGIGNGIANLQTSN